MGTGWRKIDAKMQVLFLRCSISGQYGVRETKSRGTNTV